MKILALETSSESASVALLDGERVVERSVAGNPGHSETILPEILRLLNDAGLALGEVDAIAFGAGPGSFTGLRTACAVAQGLAFGAKVPVLPVDTLLAVAEEARYLHAPEQANFPVWALLDARMDEMYAGRYVFNNGAWTQTQGHVLLSPDQLLCEPEDAIAGNVLAPYGARLNISLAHYVGALPTATALLRLAPALLAAGGAVAADQALPLYVRDKVAKTTAERAAEKAAL